MVRRSGSRGRDRRDPARRWGSSRAGSPRCPPCRRLPRSPRPARPTPRRPAGRPRTWSAGSSITGRVGDDHVGAVEEDEGPDERLRLGLARILHRGDDGEVGDGARVGKVDLALRSELDGVDRAVAPSAGVHPPARRAAQAEQPVLPGRLGGPVGGVGHRVPVGDRGEVVHPGHRFGWLRRCPHLRSRPSRRARSRRCRRCGPPGCPAIGGPPASLRTSPRVCRRRRHAAAAWWPRPGG